MSLKQLIELPKIISLLTVLVWFCPALLLAQAELPILVKQVSGANVMFVFDDSGSMYAVLEHPDFNEDSADATNSAYTFPAVIFRLESGSAAAATTHQLRPVLVEANLGFNNSSSGNLWASQTFNSPTSHALIASMSCNNSSGSTVCCPGTSGGSCPRTGINTSRLFGSSTVTGATIFQLSNLAKAGSINATDSSGNEFLYLDYRQNDWERLTDDWSDVWAEFNTTGALIPYHTRVFSTTGQTVVFNGREVFLSNGFYRLEYLRWIFYAATPAQLASLPGTNRMQAVKDVASSLVLANPQVKFGISTFNGSSVSVGTHSGNNYSQWITPDGNASTGGYPKVRTPITSNATTLTNSINSLTPRGATPLANSYIEALRYFGGASARDSYYSSTYTYTSPITSQCDANSIILLTDGLPTGESNNRLPNNNWVTSVDGIANGASSNYNCQNTSSTLCASFASDAAWWAYHNDLRGSLAGIQNITTYAIGLGLDYSLLGNIANAGGTGQSYLVTNSTEIADTLQGIVDLVLQTPTSGAGVATLDKLYGETLVFQPTFSAAAWVGHINVYEYDKQNGVLELSYDMAQVLQERDLSAQPRNIIAGYDPDNDGNTNSSIAFSSSNAATLRPELFRFVTSGAVSSALLATPIQNYTQNSAATTLIEFIHGNAFPDMRTRDDDANGLVDRLGDIVYSRPVEVGARNGNYNSMQGYTTFTSGLESEPRLLLVGSNDGMLHAFNSQTGKELWAYIPSSQLPYLERLARLTYNTQYRRSYVDGQISVEDVYINGAWRTYAMFGLRTGGTQYVVLDITDRDNPVLRWEVNSATQGGQSWSKPVVIPANGISSSNNPSAFGWYMVVGTGEGKVSAGSNILAYSLASNTPPTATVKSLSATDPAGSRTSSVASAQGDSDFNVDRLYVGTEQGDVYRVRVAGAPAAWSTERLYDGVNTQPIVAAPATVLAENPQYNGASSGVGSMALAMGVYFGTGRYDESADITSVGTTTQSIIGVFDPLNTSSDAYNNALYNITKSSLQNQSVSSFDVRRDTSTGRYLTPTGKAGFYIDLSTSLSLSTGNSYINPAGMVVYPPINARGVLVFSTFLPDTTACDIGGYGFVQGVHYQTGGGAVVDYFLDSKNPFFAGGIPDINDNNQYTSADLSLGIANNYILPALDTHIESIDLSNDIEPYSHNGELSLNDVRLHSTNGGVLPAVSSVGHTGLPGQVSLLTSTGDLLVQPAYPSDPSSGGNNGSGDPGDGEEGSQGSTGQMPPPSLFPIELYTQVLKMLSFHENTSQ